MHSDWHVLYTAADHWPRVLCFLMRANISLLIFVIVAAVNRAWRDIESPIRDFHVASVQIWMLQLPTHTEFFTWYVGVLQSIKWLAVDWMLNMQFLLEAVTFLVGSDRTALQPTKPPVELILWRLFTGKKCLILRRLLAFVKYQG